jgi:hypothetical protein
MALIIHSGTSAADLAQAGTVRQDISDQLLASLYFENNMLGITPIGEEFVGQSAMWDEDALNGFKVTDTTGGGQSAGSTTLNVSAADAAILDGYYLLQRDTQFGSGEVVQVTNVTPAGVVTIVRGYSGTTATSDGGSPQVWRIINKPTTQNSDLGKDMTRARLSKQNFINRWELNVNLDMEAIERAKAGYTVGVRNELRYQFRQRMLEMKRNMQLAYWASVSPGTSGDGASIFGLLSWLNGVANPSALTGSPTSFISTVEGLSDTVVNTMIANVFKQGGYTNLIVGGVNAIRKFSQLYSDRIRIDQSETSRGWIVKHWMPDTGVEHRLVADGYLNDVSGSAMLAVLDLSHIRIRPFANGFLYTIEAPSFRDGDAIRAMSKWSLEVRNTGSDVGFVHSLHTNLSL